MHAVDEDQRSSRVGEPRRSRDIAHGTDDVRGGTDGEQFVFAVSNSGS